MVAVNEILPIGDNLERALALQDCSAEDMRKGVEMVNTQLLDALSKLGIAVVGMEGETFNPDFHNAVSHIEDEKPGRECDFSGFSKGVPTRRKDCPPCHGSGSKLA